MKLQRCAIYTRKSSEEGLEQSFNSLDAQREACEAFIKSQAHEGWLPVKKGYNDGGFSGGSMERPGLRALLADIDAGRIDIVVVYKVDRLTRALADFAKIVDVLDKKGASFVSVTQPFNTTTSMGRLTLNVLLSFAQFEREVTGERIRDKIAASKKKGMWMGGYPSLGYDIADRKLVVNDTESRTVKHIYTRYLDLGTVKALAIELYRKGIVSKRWRTRDGKSIGGNRFSRGALYHLLSNRLYLGDISHKGHVHKGDHKAILPAELWSRVQAALKNNRHERTKQKPAAIHHVLTGLIFDDRGNRMSPSHSTKNGRRYHYYVSQALLQNRENVGSVARIPAPAIEQLVADRLRRIGEVDAVGLRSTGSPLRRVVIARSCIQIILDARFSAEEFRHRLPTTDSVAEADDVVTITIATQLNTYGGRRIVEGPNGKPASDDGFYDLPLMKTLAKAHALRELLTTGNAASLRDLAKRSGCDESRIRHLLPLAFMAPDIVTMILGGKQPRHVTVDRVVRLGMPASWPMQRQVLGLTE